MNAPSPALSALLRPVGRWHLRLLGDVVLTDPLGQVRRLPGRTATALLACLALAPERAHAREALIERLWPGVDLDPGRNRLRQLLATLKRALETAPGADTLLQADRLALRLAPDALDCDALQFEQAVRQRAFSDAALLYRGELLPGFYDEWIHEERLRLAHLAERLPAEAPPALAGPPAGPAPPGGSAAAARATPTALNLPHYLTRLYGAQAVLQQLQTAVQQQRLVTLLGPGGHGKTRLAVELAQALAHMPHPPPLRPPAPGPAPAPFDLIAFVPLVSCQGAQAQPDAVLTALLLALRQDARGAAPLEALVRLLAGRQALLVLDNFEQLVDNCASLLTELLARCPALHLLVTSRRVLGLDGEHLHLLQPLPVPDDRALGGPPYAGPVHPTQGNPALDLFVDRARAARTGFSLDGAEAHAAVALVRALQGMPLAIELAASRVRSLSPSALLDLLQQASDGPAVALQLLQRSGPRAATDPRHASLLAVVQWSWALLSPRTRALLPQLTVFGGSFSLAAAQALVDLPAAEVALGLDEAVCHSMLRSTAQPDRFEMLEPVREFAAQALPAAAAAPLRARHRRWLTGWFAGLPLSTPLQHVRPEVPNLAAALLSAEADGAPEAAAALAAAAQTAMSAISLPPAALAALRRCTDGLTDPLQRAVTRAGLARSLLYHGQVEQAEQLAALALAEAPLPDAASAQRPAAAPEPGAAAQPAWPGSPALARAQVLARVAHVRWRLHRDPAARGWLEQALQAALEAGAPGLQATILTNLGAVRRADDPTASVALQRQAIGLWRQAGDLHGINVGRCNLATALLQRRGGCAEALALLEDACAATRSTGDDLQHALACNLRGEAWSRLGRWAEAAAAYRDCTAVAWAVAEPWPLAYSLWNLPRALAHLRQAEAAARLMGFAEQHSPGFTGAWTAADRHDLRRVRRLCGRQMPAGRLAQHWVEGQRLSLAQAVGLALG